MNRQMAASILEHYMPKRNIHNKNKVDYLAYATAINALRREDALLDKVLEIIDKQQIIANHGDAVDAGINSACNYIRAEVERLKGEQE